MLLLQNVGKRLPFPKSCHIYSVSASTRVLPATDKHGKAKCSDEPEPRAATNTDASHTRSNLAPWIQIGQYNPQLLAHMSLLDILRSLSVLHICSYDCFVDRSVQLFKFSQKLGPIGSWILRSTFSRQFVGGENVDEMTKVVKNMQDRQLTIMAVSVLEEDVEDEPVEPKTYDKNLSSLLDLMDLLAAIEKDKPILQLKPTTIMSAQTLENIASSMLNYCSITDSKRLTSLIEQMANGIENPSCFPLIVNKVDQINYLDGLRRADILVQKAKECNVHILVDAELHSCKPSISMIAQSLMARHNQHGHWIGNTIQGYLQEAVPTIQTELSALTENLGVHWFGKVVRGAYLDRERVLAAKRGVESPTWRTYDETSESFNKVIQIILEHLAQQKNRGSSHLVVASHNETSIRLAADSMKKLQITPNSNQVSFAQIFGMADYLSTPLVLEQYKVYKSTPYGPMAEVIPYLSRRASENRSVMQGAREEKTMLRKELLKRLSSPF